VLNGSGARACCRKRFLFLRSICCSEHILATKMARIQVSSLGLRRAWLSSTCWRCPQSTLDSLRHGPRSTQSTFACLKETVPILSLLVVVRSQALLFINLMCLFAYGFEIIAKLLAYGVREYMSRFVLVPVSNWYI
jgi:hypothetical protein